jgi:hypothetical protein
MFIDFLPRDRPDGIRCNGKASAAGAWTVNLRYCIRSRPSFQDGGIGMKDMNELIPTGRLRVGVAFAPSPSPLFVV